MPKTKKLKINQEYIYISDYTKDGGSIVYYTGTTCLLNGSEHFVFRRQNSSEDILLSAHDVEKSISILR